MKGPKCFLLARSRLLSIALFAATISLISCDCGTEPPPPDNRPDTTSHAFAWQIDTLGDGNSSLLNDVFIAGENDIWAVGEIYFRDTGTGQFDSRAYNIAHWDGQRWNPSRVLFQVCGGSTTYPFPARSVYGFGSNDVWIAATGEVAHWNGTSFATFCIPAAVLSGSIWKIWGISSRSLYLVGELGTIVYYDSNAWEKLTTGTTLDFCDIWGSYSLRSGGYQICAVAGKLYQSYDKKIVQINGNAIEDVTAWGIPCCPHAIWFVPDRAYYVAGDGLYRRDTLMSKNTGWTPLHPGLTQYYLYGVRGSAWNDVAACGAFGEILHYNGSSWMSYRSRTGLSVGEYLNLDIRGNTIVAVGFAGERAVVALGTR